VSQSTVVAVVLGAGMARAATMAIAATGRSNFRIVSEFL
jgi:hypothetical protein